MSADRREVRAAARRDAAIIGVDALLILCVLDDHDDGLTGEVFVGIPTLVRLTGMWHQRIRDTLAEMVEAGVLVDTGRRVRNARVYRLPWGPDLTPENIATPPGTLRHLSATSTEPLRNLSGTSPVLSTEIGEVSAPEGEGEGEGDHRSPERCARPSCPNRGDFTGPAACHGCREARKRQADRDAEAATAREAARRAALLQDHQFDDDGSGLTCDRCGLPPQRHPQPTATLAPVGTVAEVVTA